MHDINETSKTEPPAKVLHMVNQFSLLKLEEFYIQYIHIFEYANTFLFSQKKIWKTASKYIGRKLLRAVPKQITSVLQADVLWSMGITGKLESYMYFSCKKIDCFEYICNF